MKTRTNRLIALVMIVFTIVALLVLFANMFITGPNGDFGGERGSAYVVLFYYWEAPFIYNPTVALIVAWCLQSAAFLALIVALFFSGKKQGWIIGISGLALLVGAIMFFCAVPIYMAAQSDIIQETFSYGFYLGAAPICNGIFAGLAGLLGLYACYSTIKAAK